MKFAFFLTVFVLAVSMTYASTQVVEHYDRTFEVTGRTRLDVHNMDGRTLVHATAGSKVIVHVIKEVEHAASPEEAKAEADRVQVEVEQAGIESMRMKGDIIDKFASLK